MYILWSIGCAGPPMFPSSTCQATTQEWVDHQWIKINELTHPCVNECRPGNAIETSIFPPIRQHLFQLQNISLWYCNHHPPHAINIRNFPFFVVMGTGSYHSMMLMVLYHKSTTSTYGSLFGQEDMWFSILSSSDWSLWESWLRFGLWSRWNQTFGSCKTGSWVWLNERYIIK